MKEYDLIFSLGANCSAAHNLLIRGLRPFALPFDWTFFKDEKAIYNLADGFRDGFRSFMQYENLAGLDGSEYNKDHSDNFQYKDTKTDYYFVNHFTEPLHDRRSYDVQMVKFRRRFERLSHAVAHAQKICIVAASNFYISKEPLEYLIKTIHDVFGHEKLIDIYMLNFSCQEKRREEKSGITIYRYQRPISRYDFTHTNMEWAFLDDIRLSKKHVTYEKSFSFKMIKRGMDISIFPNAKSLITVNLYFFGLRLMLSCGKRKLFK